MNDRIEQGGTLNAIEATAAIGGARITIGFVQGIVAWLLLRLVAPLTFVSGSATPNQGFYWSERHPILFAASALVTAYVPVIAIAELPRMRRKVLVLYLLLAAAAVAGLAAYDIWRDPIESNWQSTTVRVWPSWRLCVCATLGLFIVNQLLEHRERGKALFSEYSKHFEDSWMRGFQLIISLIFSLLVWGVLELGATLFDLIHVGWFRTMIQHNWFICPALAMAFAAAIQVTDVRPALLKGMRNVVLTLLAWLLPLVLILSLGFLIALLFVGLRPLWETRHAASILFWACALTVFLLNAAYKDGDPSMLPNVVIRLAGRVAGFALLPLALIGSFAIALRVHQYGWTPERIISAAIALMALIYSCGYLFAATHRQGWITPLEPVNVFASLAILTILVLLLTPIGDPDRLSVNSQLARLANGTVSASKLDYSFLRFDSGTYGRNALARLVAGADEDARARAARVQASTVKAFPFRNGAVDSAASEAAFSHATVFPKGTHLPPDFTGDAGRSPYYVDPACIHNGSPCEIYVVPYGGDGKQALIVRSIANGQRPEYIGDATGVLYQRDGAGRWIMLGTLRHMGCAGVVTALRNGTLASVAPEHDDLLVAGVRLELSRLPPDTVQCAPPVPAGTSLRRESVPDARAPAQMGPAFAH